MEEEKDFSLTFKHTFNILVSVLSYSHFCIVRNSSGCPSPICQTPLKIFVCNIPAYKLILKLLWKIHF